MYNNNKQKKVRETGRQERGREGRERGRGGEREGGIRAKQVALRSIKRPIFAHLVQLSGTSDGVIILSFLIF
jgi:hypothetical protein